MKVHRSTGVLRSAIASTWSVCLLPLCVASAAPRESASCIGVLSISTEAPAPPFAGYGQPFPAPGLQSRTFAVTGGYTARQIILTAALQSAAALAQPANARIWVQPPGNRPGFAVSPFGGHAHPFSCAPVSITGWSVGLPGDGLDPAGQWTLTFYDLTASVAPPAAESVWSDLTLTFDDAPLPPPAMPDASGGEAVTLFNLPSDGVRNTASNGLATFSLTGVGAGGSYQAVEVLITGQLSTASAPGPSLPGHALIALTAPDGAQHTVQLLPGAGASPSLLNAPVARVLIAPTPRSPQGLWQVRAFQSVDAGEGTDAVWTALHIVARPYLPAPAPASENLGTLTSAISRPAVPVSCAEPVRWFRFTLPVAVSLANRNFLDITTFGSALTPSPDTVLALFNAAGVPIAIDDDAGCGDTPDDSGCAGPSVLTFGAPVRALPSGSIPADGRSGSLEAGEYHLAVSSFGLQAFPGFQVQTSPANTGPISLLLQPGTLPPATPPGQVIDLGLIAAPGLTVTPPPQLTTGTAWYAFRIAAAADATHWLDIDTEGSTLVPLNDPAIALYIAAGDLLVSDAGSGSSLNSHLTFGQTSPSRPPIGDGAPYDGRHGPLPAGTYYLALHSAADSVFYPVNFQTAPAALSTGPAALRFATSIPAPPATCNLADITGIGGPPEIPDGLLTGDDFNAFITAFAAGDTLADVCGIGGPPEVPDGLITGDDFVAFIAAFAGGCP